MAEGRSDHECGSDVVENEEPAEGNNERFGNITIEFEKVFKDGGIEGLHNWINQKLDAWQNTPVNIAVVGRSGVGKSSFINAIRNLKVGDEGAADVGVSETTITVQYYAYPKQERILLWDLPGVGTLDFKQNEYEEKINSLIGTGFNDVTEIGSFDAYLILTANRFTENDSWFVEKIKQNYKKRYYFVRTHVKRSIKDDKNSRRVPRSDKEILDFISSDCKAKLKQTGFPCEKVYLIDNHSPDKFDFKTLTEDIVAHAPEVKYDALVFAIGKLTKHIIEMKQEQLEDRLVSAAVTGIYFPWLEKEVEFYKEQLCLTEGEILGYAEKLGLSVDMLINHLELKSCKHRSVSDAYAELHGGTIGPSYLSLGLSAASFLIHSRSNILAVVCALGAYGPEVKKTFQFLYQMLSWCVEDAMKIQHAICKSSISYFHEGGKKNQ